MAVRWALALGAIALAAAAVINHRAYLVGAREVERLLDETGLAARQGDFAEQIRREPDPFMGRLQVARALVAEALDPSSFRSLPAREAALEAGRVGERLELAEAIAAQATVARPVVWQGWMILGAARHLRWSRAGDSRLLTERRRWEEPLEKADALAPAEEEPNALLAAAHLELWPMLDAGARSRARRELERAFTSEADLRRLLPTWLAVADSRDEAFALIPDVPSAWRQVLGDYERIRDWPGWIAVRQRWVAALDRAGASRLSEARERLRGGDEAGARTLLAGIIDDAPAERAFAAVVEEALRALPAGLDARANRAAFGRWLRWSMDLTVRGVPALSPTAAGRLLSASSEMKPADAALAALVAGDLAGAEAIERRFEDLNTEAWAPYCIAKARVLAARNERAGARAILALVQRSWRGSVPETEARAAALGEPVADPGLESWPGTVWRWRGPVVFADIRAARGSTGLSIAWDLASTGGAIVEVRVDGAVFGLAVAMPGESATLVAALEPGPHFVEVRSVAGGRVVPGEFHLLPD